MVLSLGFARARAAIHALECFCRGAEPRFSNTRSGQSRGGRENTMIYIRGAELKEARDEGTYPFSVRAALEIDRIRCETPFTILTGGNGCGKTTVMEIYAALLGAARIGNARSAKADAADACAGAFRLVMAAKAKSSFFFSAEDFIKYVEWVEAERRGAMEELKRIDGKYGPHSYARMPYCRTISELNGMYEGTLSAESHGEGFIDFFKSRIIKNGLYLLDEPEGALSYENQYLLSLILMDAAQMDCQFIISTHSPVITAVPGAVIYQIDANGAARKAYDELENISFLKLFMARRDAFFQD